MDSGTDIFGISTALLTPFDGSGTLDLASLGAHARRMLECGADSVTLFGTTGEAASISQKERRAGLDTLLQAGCPTDRIILATCANAAQDAASQVMEGHAHGVTRFLVVPPFYFKGVSDAGLFAWHAELLALTDPATQFILYHIPQITGVSLSVDLINRLVQHAPDRLIAIKDSSGDWDNATTLVAKQPLPVLVGDERLLHRAVGLGGGGAISGVANLYPERMKRIVSTAQEDKALSAEVDRIVSVPVIPALKALLADQVGHTGWNNLRAPLEALSTAERDQLFQPKEHMLHG